MRLNDDQAKALGLGHLIPPRPKSAASPDGMNKTERAYSEYLQWLVEAGQILEWHREPFNLRLAGRTFYKPDFLIVGRGRWLILDEIKGFMRDDAAVKLKVAAEKYGNIFAFRLVTRAKGGKGWDIRHVGRAGIAAAGRDRPCHRLTT